MYTCFVLIYLFFSFFFDLLIPPILSPWMSLKMELGTVMFPWWFNTHRMLRLLSLLIFIYLCCLVRCLIWSLVNMYARLTTAPHPSFFYDLHTRFSIFHAYHMQIHPSLVPPSSLDLALLSLSLSLWGTRCGWNPECCPYNFAPPAIPPYLSPMVHCLKATSSMAQSYGKFPAA